MPHHARVHHCILRECITAVRWENVSAAIHGSADVFKGGILASAHITSGAQGVLAVEGVRAASSSERWSAMVVAREGIDGDEAWSTPEPVRRFLCEAIQSLDALELLRLLTKAPVTWWSLGDIARELRLAGRVTEEALDALCRARLLIRREEHCFGYRPANARDHELVKCTLAAYHDRPAEVARILSSRAVTRMRLSLNYLTELLGRAAASRERA
jgi:hypothetical protein